MVGVLPTGTPRSKARSAFPPCPTHVSFVRGLWEGHTLSKKESEGTGICPRSLSLHRSRSCPSVDN